MSNPFMKPVPGKITSVDMVHPQQSEGGISMVVLERVEPGVTPEYCVHGKTTCYACDEWCWLGDETYKIVKSGRAAGLCLECAAKRLPPEARPSSRVHDHRRADGPH